MVAYRVISPPSNSFPDHRPVAGCALGDGYLVLRVQRRRSSRGHTGTCPADNKRLGDAYAADDGRHVSDANSTHHPVPTDSDAIGFKGDAVYFGGTAPIHGNADE